MSQQRKGAAVLQVFVFKDGEYVGTDMFSEREVVVGRDASSADLVLDSTEVSRSHAIIEHDGERVYVRDAGSTNGVYINQRKIDRSEVGRLDEVHLGDYSLKLKLVVKSREVPLESGDPTRLAQMPEEIAALRQGKAVVFEEKTAVEAPSVTERSPAKKDDRRELEKREAERREADRREAERREADRRDAEKRREAERREQDRRDAERREAEARRSKPQRAPEREEPSLSQMPTAIAGKGKKREPEPRRPEPRKPMIPGSFDFKRPTRWDDAEELEEHEEEEQRADFSLLAKVDAVPQSTTADHASVEVLTVRGDSLTNAVVLSPGDTFWIGHHRSLLQRKNDLRERMRLVRVQRNGTCTLEVPVAASGTLKRGRESIELAAFAREGKKVGRRTAVLRPGERLEVVDAPHRYQIRFVKPPKLPVDRRDWKQKIRPEKDLERSLGGSVACHVLVALLGIFWTGQDFAPEEQTESFAEVTLDKELKLEEPAPPPPQPVQDAPQAPTPPKHMEAAPSKVKPKEGGTAKAPPGILGLLSKTGSAAAPGPAAALAAASNLSAANAPAGASGYRVSGLIGKMPTSDISLGGGGGGLVTKGAGLLRGGGGGGGVLAGKGDRAVGGQVIKMPQAMRSVGQGSLDRDAIQKVINQNVSQIQRCYERELLKNPGLSGKIEAEWVITTSGSVRSARQKFTDLGSSAVVSCILDKIKGWKFPQPKGGEVVVSYPFLFKSISF